MPATFTWTDASVRQALGLPGGDPRVSYAGVSTDTRTLRRGEIFLALRGDRLDGHDFVAEAVSAGCGAVIAQGDPGGCAVPVYRVSDTLKSLGDLALHRRLHSAVPVVGITGSSGKTTVKDLALGALAGSHSAHGTTANLNNRVGTPLTILSMPRTATALVLELGTSEPGEIAELARMSRPTIGVVTTVSETHTERLGDLEGVLAEKLDLLRALGGKGAAVVGDEPVELARAARPLHPRLAVAGWSPRADADLRPAGARRNPRRDLALHLAGAPGVAANSGCAQRPQRAAGARRGPSAGRAARPRGGRCLAGRPRLHARRSAAGRRAHPPGRLLQRQRGRRGGSGHHARGHGRRGTPRRGSRYNAGTRRPFADHSPRGARPGPSRGDRPLCADRRLRAGRQAGLRRAHSPRGRRGLPCRPVARAHRPDRTRSS